MLLSNSGLTVTGNGQDGSFYSPSPNDSYIMMTSKGFGIDAQGFR